MNEKFMIGLGATWDKASAIRVINAVKQMMNEANEEAKVNVDADTKKAKTKIEEFAKSFKSMVSSLLPSLKKISIFAFLYAA